LGDPGNERATKAASVVYKFAGGPEGLSAHIAEISEPRAKNQESWVENRLGKEYLSNL
jgi:hypothetical protein